MTTKANGAHRFGRRGRVPFIPSRRCDLHAEDLVEGEVPIVYGLPTCPAGYEEAKEQLFPRAAVCRFGGCIVSPGQASTAHVWFCRSCRKAEKAWRRSNPNGVLPAWAPKRPRPRDGFRSWLDSLRLRR